MATKRTSVVVVDKKESLPLKVNHLTREWEIFDPATNSYKSTGIKAIPEDDATAVKYYKLTNTLTAPEAPGDTQTSWADIASLNTAVITNGGWSADPLQVSKDNRFCWSAYYSLENIYDVATGTYSRRYKLNLVGLYNNFASSPTISIGEDGKVTITNPDGTTQTVQLMTAGSYDSLEAMVSSLQSQVDSAIYSYSGSGAPTKTHTIAPINSWGIPAGATSNIIADIYSAHVGDTYTDTDTYVSYRFVLKGGHSISDPLSYEWQVIADGALSAALAEIASLGNKSVKIFTSQPTAPYKVGDMWLDNVGETVIKTCIIAKDTNGTFAETDWLVPFATKAEVEVIRGELETAKTNIATAQGNLSELETHVTNLEDVTLVAMEDSLISESERQSIKAYKNVIDTEQEQLQSNVNYLTSSTYLSAEQKTTIQNAANKLLTATTGSLDKLQAAIAAILNTSGEQGDIITTAERTAYQNALATYKVDHKDLTTKIATARSQVDAELKRLADKKVDDLRIGGRNLLSNTKTHADNLMRPYNSSSETYRGFNVNRVTFTTSYIEAVDQATIEPVMGTEYVCSFNARADVARNIRCHFHGPNTTTFAETSTGQTSASIDGSVELSVTTEWKQYWIRWKQTPTSTIKSIIIGRIFSVGWVEVAGFKLEEGNKPTDWTLAPEDVQAEIDAAVVKATYWSIKATSPVIYKDANSAIANGVHTPVTVNGELRSGTTATPGGFISIQPNGGAETTATASPRTITPTDTEGKTSYTVRLYDTATKTKLLDTMTIPVVFKGSSGINISMSNEADVLHADSAGLVTDYADSGNVIRVFEGGNELAYKTPTTAIIKGISTDISAKNVQNLVVNGDFRNGLTGWGSYGAGISVIENGYMKYTPQSTVGAVSNGIKALSAGDKWYIKAVMKSDSEVNCTAGFVKSAVGVRLIPSTTIGTSDTTMSGIITIENVLIDELIFGRPPVQQPIYIKSAFAINLTATFGAGNEPTVEECNKLFPSYFDGTIKLSDIALGGNGTYNVLPTLSTGITPGVKSANGLACNFANASNMTTDSAKISFTINGLTNSGTPFSFTKPQNFSKSKTGVKGADALVVTVNIQGHFRNYYEREVVGSVETWVLKKEVVGGEFVNTTEFVKATATIRKGTVDVTASAIAKGANLTWRVGSTIVKQAGTAVDANILFLGIEYANGEDDQVHLDYDDTNAATW